MILECFSSFSTKPMHAQVCIRWLKYTTGSYTKNCRWGGGKTPKKVSKATTRTPNAHPEKAKGKAVVAVAQKVEGLIYSRPGECKKYFKICI